MRGGRYRVALAILKRAVSTNAAVPGLSFNPRLIVHKEAHALKALMDAHVVSEATTSEKCTELVPDAIQRAIPRLKRDGLIGDRLHDRRSIRMVDGTSISVNMKPQPVFGRSKLRTSEDAPRIGHLRMEQRVQSSIAAIISTVSFPELVRQVPWRVSSVQLSPSFRNCTVWWTIEQALPSEDTKLAVKSALERAVPTIRYHLARQLTLGFTPDISFEYQISNTMPPQLADSAEG